MSVMSALLVKIRVTCAAPECALSKLSNYGVYLEDIHKENDITVLISVKPTDYKLVISLLTKWQIDYTVCDDSAIKRIPSVFQSRVVLKFAVLLLVVLSLYLPGRILFVFVSGNNTIPSREIVEAASVNGVCFGAKSADIRSEKVKNGLLERIPNLQWVGVNTAGCIATIQVEEKSATNSAQNMDPTVISIVASTSGIVNSCTATQGTMLCKIGQAVSEGETLISGYTDCGIVIKATQAKGEVYALTTHSIDAVSPISAPLKGEIIAKETRYSLRLGKKLINFNNSSGIYHGSCAKIYEEQCVVLPGGYVLPVSIQKETIISYQCDAKDASLWLNEKQLVDYIDKFLIGRLVAGEINRSYVTIEKSDHLIMIRTRYICTEMIGREKAEQLIQGDYHSD